MKRTLRPSIRKTLEIITLALIVMLGSLEDFNGFGSLLFLFSALGILMLNVKILEKF